MLESRNPFIIVHSGLQYSTANLVIETFSRNSLRLYMKTSLQHAIEKEENPEGQSFITKVIIGL